MTQTNKKPASGSPPRSERDLFAADWDQNISTASSGRTRSARNQKARSAASLSGRRRRRSIVIPSVLLSLALVAGSFAAAWYLGTHGSSGTFGVLKAAEQKQYDDYVQWLNALPKPSSWSEETFETLKTGALNAYDRTLLDQIQAASSGDEQAREALGERTEASDQSRLDTYRNLLEHGDDYPQPLIEAALSDPGLMQFVLEYPKHAGSSPDEVTLGSVEEMPDLKTFDPNWGYTEYGNSIFALSGGAPTAIADVFSWLREDPSITPYAVGSWAKQFDYDKTPVRETDDSIFGGAALTWGVSMNPIPTYRTQISSYVQQGYPVIIATGTMESPKFYVLKEMDENGSWIALDPLSSDSPVVLNPEKTADSLLKAYAFW